jgi:hypothetical protein
MSSVNECRCWVINTPYSYEESPDFDARLPILTGRINVFFTHCSECWDNTFKRTTPAAVIINDLTL